MCIAGRRGDVSHLVHVEAAGVSVSSGMFPDGSVVVVITVIPLDQTGPQPREGHRFPSRLDQKKKERQKHTHIQLDFGLGVEMRPAKAKFSIIFNYK